MRVLARAIREEPRLFAISVVGSVLFGALTIGGAYIIGAVVGNVVLPIFDADSQVDRGALVLGAAALVGLSLTKILSIFGRRLGAGYMQFSLQARYRRRVTRKYLDLPVSWHQKHATGTLLSNANSDVEAAWYPIAPMPFAVGTVVMMVGAVVILFATDWVLGLIGAALFPTLAAINVAYSRRMAPRQMLAQRLRAEVSAIAHESFDGALIVKTMGRETSETERFAVKARELRDALIRVGRLRGLFEPILDILPSLGTLAALLVGAWRLEQGAVTITEMISVCYLFTVMAMPVRAIGWVLAEVPRSVAGWDRVQNVLTATGEMPYGAGVLGGRPGTPAVLRFDRVNFAYELTGKADVIGGDEPTGLGPEVLHGIGFEVAAGRTIALVGRTGSGKSTIASLAARLVDTTSGAVTIDGVDVRELTAASLAATVALVPQVAFVFDDSVRANVALDRAGPDGQPITDEEVWAALKLAQADGFISALPDGLDTAVGERGTTLSGGQRQRLTLARALAGKPRVLVLDDATSAVDPRVEAAILAGLRDSRTPTSVLVVAYRRATIALADEVVYVEHGRVVARGTHTELLATIPGYANLVTAYEQAEAERERERAFDEESLEVSA
jgi:ABC-type multidrug transport system fused ATPase/permease subunit